MVNFEDGTLVKGAYVEIDGVQYPVHMPQYSGNTSLSAENLNKAQKDIQNQLDNATEELDITWETGIEAQSSQKNSIKINKIEKSCMLEFGVTTNTAKEIAFRLGSFSSQYAPKKIVFGTAVISTNTATTACQCSVGTDGSININNVGQSSSIFRGQIKWFYE